LLFCVEGHCGIYKSSYNILNSPLHHSPLSSPYPIISYLNEHTFFCGTGFELRAYTLSYSTSPFFVMGFFKIVSQTVCSGWLQTEMLLVSASWVARITGMSHQHPTECMFLNRVLLVLVIMFFQL
jgi:hypothetical protein